MKRILVPIDFSAVSRDAAEYAAQLALKLGASIELLHVVTLASSSTKLMNWKKLEDEMIRTAQENAKEFLENFRHPVNLNYTQRSGYPTQDVIEEFVKEQGIDLIVIGTHGASGLKKTLVGSNAASVINASSVPVLAIPAGYAFKGIQNIVYATSMTNLDHEVKALAAFARNFDSLITIVHISERHSGKRDFSNLKSILGRMAAYDKLQFEVIENARIEDGVSQMVEDQKPDVLAMFTHELDTYEKIFGKGVTRNIAFEVKVPLLAYNKTKLK